MPVRFRRISPARDHREVVRGGSVGERRLCCPNSCHRAAELLDHDRRERRGDALKMVDQNIDYGVIQTGQKVGLPVHLEAGRKAFVQHDLLRGVRNASGLVDQGWPKGANRSEVTLGISRLPDMAGQ